MTNGISGSPAGIAHDLNNEMMLILNHLECALQRVPAGSGLHGSLSDVRRAAERCTDMIDSLFDLANPPRRPIDLKPVLEESLRLLRGAIPANIEARSYLEPNLPHTAADPTAIHQVITNLVLNAVEAMPGGGTLTVEARRSEGGVLLTVTDTGCGMPPELQARIFEPHVSTKSASRGHGLGLAMVAGILKDHGAGISVTSAPGAGSCFRIQFPSAKMD